MNELETDAQKVLQMEAEAILDLIEKFPKLSVFPEQFSAGSFMVFPVDSESNIMIRRGCITHIFVQVIIFCKQ